MEQRCTSHTLLGASHTLLGTFLLLLLLISLTPGFFTPACFTNMSSQTI